MGNMDAPPRCQWEVGHQYYLWLEANGHLERMVHSYGPVKVRVKQRQPPFKPYPHWHIIKEERVSP